MSVQAKERVSRWLDEAAASMGGDAAHRRDVVLELESTIYDRIEERARKGEDADDAARVVLQSMGEAGEVGGSFLPDRALLAAHQTRPFLVNTLGLFAAHFLLVIGASVAGRPLGFWLLQIAPMASPDSITEILARLVQTLFLDAGTMLCLFAFLPRVTHLLRFPRAALAVRPNARRCVEGAFFLGLVLVVVNFLREDMLALYVPADGGMTQVSLVGPGLRDNLLFFNVWIAMAIARDLLYARLGERPATLSVDMLSAGAGLFCLLRIAAADRLVDLSNAQMTLGPSADTVATLLNGTFSILALVTAAVLAARAVRRAFRLALIRG